MLRLGITGQLGLDLLPQAHAHDST
jgi:hypothetical protein